MRPRISIARLLALVVFFAVGLAALRSPSNLGANALVTLTLAALVVAVINVMYSRGRVRAFWAGFLIAGGTYFLISTVPFLRDAIGERLVTVPLLDILYPYLVQPEPKQTPPVAWTYAGAHRVVLVSRGGFGGPPQPEPGRWAVWTEPDRDSGVGAAVGGVFLASPWPYRLIGHSLLTLVVATMGGLYARRRHDLCHTTRPTADLAASFSFDTRETA